MGFASKAGAAAILVTMTLWLQCAGMAVLIRWARASIARGLGGLGPWRGAVLMVRFATVLIVLHVLQILLWAGFYRWQCLPSWEACFYYSASSYSTVGYGDVVLPQGWHAVGPVESITGVLMCGLSVSLLFAVAARMVAAGAQLSRRGAIPPAGSKALRETPRAIQSK